MTFDFKKAKGLLKSLYEEGEEVEKMIHIDQYVEFCEDSWRGYIYLYLPVVGDFVKGFILHPELQSKEHSIFGEPLTPYWGSPILRSEGNFEEDTPFRMKMICISKSTREEVENVVNEEIWEIRKTLVKVLKEKVHRFSADTHSFSIDEVLDDLDEVEENRNEDPQELTEKLSLNSFSEEE